ncbi:MAG: lysophospholipid acyltransferase family protein [Pseudomonadota bacterium]|nr:lysophospholipid acyltransferase family protein [Pseudomonadota bacterium]
MDLTIAEIAALPIPLLRQGLATWVASHVDTTPGAIAALRSALEARLAAASDPALATMLAAFAVAGTDYRLYEADPFARDMTRLYMAALTPTWSAFGLDTLDAWLTSGPARRMVVCNHLSYTDTQLTDSLLALEGRAAFADRLVAIAGPKVYTDAWRRLAAISLNTRKTVQSSAVATEQGSLTAREVATVAIETLRDCERMMDAGYVMLLYPEGTRSRTGRLQPFLRAAGRYLQIPGLSVMPMAQTGSERIFPIDDPIMHPGHVRVAFGAPFVSEAFPGKHGALAEAHARIGALLPAEYQPESQAGAIG